MSKNLKGSFITLIAGSFWGISGASGQVLIKAGVSVNLLTSLRLVIAGLVLTALVAWREPDLLKRLFKDKQSLAQIALFSLFGLTINQFAYLKAIQHTNSGTATVLQYLAPILILILVCTRERRRPFPVEMLAIVLAIVGVFFMATHGDFSQLALTPLGLVWGIFSAFTYVAYILLPSRVIKRWGSLPVIGVGMLMGGLVFPLATQSFRSSAQLSLETLPAYIGIIGLGTIMAYTLFLKGVSMIGPVKGSLLASIEPVAAVIFAVLLLNETFYPMDLLGMLFIVVAVGLISWQDLKNS